LTKNLQQFATTPPLSLPQAEMSQSPTKVQFTIGKLDAGMAILLTEDHHQIEFPSILLPRTVTTGSIIDLSVSQNPTQEARVHTAFLSLQSTIRQAFAAKSPLAPVLKLRNATQTSAVLEWDPIDIATAELKSLTLWRDGTRLGNIPKPMTTTTTKLSGLAIDTDYIFQLVLRTTAGTYSSNDLKVQTHKLANLSGITVCAGTLPPESHDRLIAAIEAIGAKPLQKRVRIDTTHFICSVPEGEEWQRAKEMNVPIVVVDWIEACQRQGRIIGVRGYYLDDDPALRPKAMAPLPPVSPTPSRSSQVGYERLSVGQASGSEKGFKGDPPVSPGVVKTDVVAASDQESAGVSSTAGDVAPAVSEPTSIPATDTTPEPKKAKVESTNEKGDNGLGTEAHVGEDPAATEEKFDDVPI
jgi:chitin biosynthesis protein CHS5